VVVWKKGRAGRFYPEVVEVAGVLRRVKRGGGFALGCDVTRDVVRVMVMALRVRERLLKGLNGVDRASRAQVVGIDDRIEGWCVDVGYWRTVMGGRLDGRFGG
ncbi:hypothetical protein, partial [Ferrovum sp.]|uniref:hypothetical protein n=1 Tax=Ferrovum sp. TaxID=2609467 RepID=UPI00260706B1